MNAYARKFDRQLVNASGEALDLAFVYDGTAYYFSPDVWSDEESTASCELGEDPQLGLGANEALEGAIARYGIERGPVWIAPWFRRYVSSALAGRQGRDGR